MLALMSADQSLRWLYEAYQDRDWDRARDFLHPAAVVVLPATSERLDGRDHVIGFQRRYPEPWGDLAVLRVIGGEMSAAGEIEVRAPSAAFRMAAFWETRDGLLWRGTEYWVDLGGTPPAGREHAVASA